MGAADASRPVLRSVLNLVLMLVGGYALLCAAVFVLQHKLIWFPSRAVFEMPDQLGREYRDVVLTAADGVELHAWRVAARGPEREPERGVVIVCHGNAGNVSNRVDCAAAFAAMGYGVLLFDYRGYGRSQGRPSEEGTYLDAEAAWRQLVEVEGLAPGKVALYGESLGAAVASELARRRPCGALFVESAFTSLPDLAARVYPLLPARWLARVRYPTERNVAGLELPVLVAHSREDDIVPFAHGERLHAAARAMEPLLVTEGPHNAGGFLRRAEWRERVGAFLDRALAEAEGR
jgi:fermentation-respiration switch protein FrsA (DUF1100 family)